MPPGNASAIDKPRPPCTIYGLLRDSYQLKEVSAPKGYQLAGAVIVTSTNFDSKGAVIKIIDKIEKTSVSGTKTWRDNNNQDGIRPSSITVNLLANGQQVASKKVSASDNWQYSFDNLAAYANGQKITYTVTEDAVAGYTSTVDGYNITNTHNPTTPEKPQVPNNGNKVTPKDFTQGKMYDKTSRLPQTGDGSSMGMMLIGLVTLLLSLGLVVISRFTI
ncbi:Cna B-type domain-containing protein [Pediococcus pentosaceus]|nr:Cna B-type domain-containing protein [Pediococcus pentosaceus]MBF7122584.1 Cna B-type domain-containing protein [Pediococcus pentosaceus]